MNASPPFKLDESDPISRWRRETFYTKEPHTVEWIRGFHSGALFLDVGANIGIYSLYSAALGHTVVSLEPESQNFAALYRNIFANNFQDRITAYPLALTSENQPILNNLFLSEFITGGSCHNAGESKNWRGDPMNTRFRQGCITLSYRMLKAFSCVEPEYIKIDVDGNEPDVIAGLELRKRTALKSLCVEVNMNRDDHKRMIYSIVDCGFRFDGEQVAKALRPAGHPFFGCAEIIFTRA